jgi:hypothetical protein
MGDEGQLKPGILARLSLTGRFREAKNQRSSPWTWKRIESEDDGLRDSACGIRSVGASSADFAREDGLGGRIKCRTAPAVPGTERPRGNGWRCFLRFVIFRSGVGRSHPSPPHENSRTPAGDGVKVILYAGLLRGGWMFRS